MMSKVVVRRNFGCGTKLTAFSHRKNLTRKAPPIAPEPASATQTPVLPIEEQAERLSYLLYLLLSGTEELSEWEETFLDSMETRMERRRALTDKQAAVVERMITKYRTGSNPYNEYLREKRSKGPNYVSFLPENINEEDTDLC